MSSVPGTPFNDILTPTLADDQFDGGAGFDFVDYSAANPNLDPSAPRSGVSVSLSNSGTASGALAIGDTFTNIEGLIGSSYDDLLDGDTGDNELRGGAGNDLLFGDDGADTLDGGSGIDAVFYHQNATPGRVVVDLEDQSRNAGAAAGDVLRNIEDISGTAFDDDISGDAGANMLTGRDGNDRLDGRGGNDNLFGNEGNDTLIGGAGYDTAFFSGSSSAFHWVRNGDGSWTVTDSRSGGEGTDILYGIEALSFDDRAYGLPNSLEADDIFRFYNTKTRTHFYTNSDSERDFIIANYKNYKYEGNAFDTTATADTGIGVYRFYNTKTKTHFYTANTSERDYIKSHYVNFKYEGVAYYAYADSANGAHIPLYRFYNTKTNTHFFTANADEQQYVASHYQNFKYEGIAYYVDLA